MVDSLLIRTLRLLSQEEMETLHLFVATPIFNEVRPKETRDLFEYLKKYYPDFVGEDIHRERVAARFFPRHSKPDAELQRTMAQLMQIVRQFITFRYSNVHKGKTAAASSTKDPAENPFLLLNNARQQLALIRFYSERLYQNPSASLLLDPGGRKDRDGQETRKSRRLENLFENLYKDTKRTLHASEQFDGYNEYIFNDLYYFRYLLEQEKALYVSLYDQRAGDKNLLVAMEALDQYYLISKLDLMAKLIHFQRMSDLYLGSTEENERLKTNKLFTQQLVQTLIDSGYLQTPVLQLYCILLQLITLDDPIEAEKVYDLFCQLLDQNGKAIPARRMTDLKVMLRSFWPSRYRETKDRRFLERLHHMHCEHLDIAPEGQEIPGSHFFNIIVTAVKLDKLDWAEDFFQAYQPRIFETQVTAWLITLCETSILFGRGQYAAAEKRLGHYIAYGEIEDIYLYSVAATLDTRIRYEKNELESDESERMMHTTSTRIKRDKSLPKNRQEERLRFFSITKALYKLQERRFFDKKADLAKDVDKIRQRIYQETVVDWEWLLAKCDELGSPKRLFEF